MDKCQRKVSVCARQKSLQGVLKEAVSGEADCDKREDKLGITCGAARPVSYLVVWGEGGL